MTREKYDQPKEDHRLSYLSERQNQRWEQILDLIGKKEAIKQIAEKVAQAKPDVPQAMSIANAIDEMWEQVRRTTVGTIVDAVITKLQDTG